jgi:hypothetical protein
VIPVAALRFEGPDEERVRGPIRGQESVLLKDGPGSETNAAGASRADRSAAASRHSISSRRWLEGQLGIFLLLFGEQLFRWWLSTVLAAMMRVTAVRSGICWQRVSIFLRLERRSVEAISAASPRCTVAAFTQGLT